MASNKSHFDSLPKKRMGAGCLFLDEHQRVLLVKPTYKPGWEIPGGIVELNESPKKCCEREVLEEIGFSPEEARKLKTYKGKGCPSCNDTGYKGRIGLYEVMDVTDEIRELILIGASALELRKKSIEDGMISLRESGLQKIRNGITTIEEVLRETVA